MKQIFEIFKSDIKEIFRKVNTWIIIIGLIVLPSMYAWPNILSSWDPYSHTNNLKVAVISEDEGATVEGKNVNLGESLITNLKGNKNLDWQFVSSKQQAEDGVKIGDYYASIVIPKSFSSDITSITRGELKKATIEYSVNEKINAISPKITNSGASALANTIGKNFVEVANGVIFEKLHEAGIKYEENLPTLEKIKGEIFKINDNFTNYENSLNELIGKVDRGYNVLNIIQRTLPEIDKAATNSIMLANKTDVTITDIEGFNEKIIGAIREHLEDVLNISSEIIDVAKVIQNKTDSVEDVKTNMKVLDSRLEVVYKKLDVVKNIFEYFNSLSNQNIFKNQLNVIENIESNVSKLRSINEEIYKNIDYYDNISDDKKEEFIKFSQRINKDVTEFNSKLNSDIAPRLQQVLSRVDNKVQDISEIISAAQAELPSVNKQISETEEKIQTAYGKLLKLQSEMPIIKSKVQELVNQIKKSEGVDSSTLFNFLKVDYKQQAEFFANPVQLKENQLYHIKNYGSAMTPFYTVLSIWVGALLMSSLLTTKVEDEENKYKPYQKYFGRGLLFMIISLLQTLIITLGDMYLLGTQANSPYRFVIYALLISLLFSAIIYTTVCLLGNVGKAVCIILLVLQIGSSGGTFPIQMTSSFFQTLYPKVPFTYSIGLLREAVGGVYIPAVNRDMKILLTYLVITLVGGAILVSLKARSAKLSRERERSKLFL